MKINNARIPDSVYKEVVKSIPICTVDIVLFNLEKNKILLCKRNNKPLEGAFLTNGGRLYKNEELEDAAVRIAKEELGLEIKKDKLMLGGVMNQIFDTSIYENENYHVVDVFFGCIVPESVEIKLDSQHSLCEWFFVDDKNLHPYIKKMIEIFIPKLKQS